jgi:hypothetical protein
MLVGDQRYLFAEIQQDNAEDQANEAAPEAQNWV